MSYKKVILQHHSYTELVYGRIAKKLDIALSKVKIEKFIITIIRETEEENFQKKGKNIYISNQQNKVRLTINSYTNRIITADKLSGNKGINI